MRSPLAYTPRPGPLQSASPGAAVAYLGSYVAIALLFSTPLVLIAVLIAALLAGLLAGAREAVAVALRMGAMIVVMIVAVNGLLSSRGDTVLARLGEWPLLGRVDITAQTLVAGLSLGLRALAVMVAFAVYSACVDPDRVLRAVRPLAARSALTATLICRLVPVAAADSARLSEAARLRGPGATSVGVGALARRLLAGSLDRAVDVAATLELRGYALQGSRARRRTQRSRHDSRFYLSAAIILIAAITAKLLGVDGFQPYPNIVWGVGPPTLLLCTLILASGLVPWQRRRPSPSGARPRPAPRASAAVRIAKASGA